jgi:hypothetical protein
MSSFAPNEFLMKQGDLLPLLAYALVMPDGTPADLDGADVFFNMARASDGVTVLARAPVTVPDPASNEVVYEWQPADTEDAGRFNAEFEVVFANGRPLTFPARGYIPIVISPDLG